jgi:hypothetical protein
MKQFLLRSLYFLAFPFFLFVTSVFAYWLKDPYKILRTHSDYSDVLEITPGNMYSTRIASTENYNAYIFGNSRTLAIPPSLWKHYLPKSARPFQYWAPGDHLLGIAQKVFLLHRLGKSIDHAIIVLCPCASFDIFDKPYESQHYAFKRQHPVLFHTEYYWKAIQWETAFLNPAWLNPFIKRKENNGRLEYIREGNEHGLKQEKLIKQDSLAYYSQATAMGEFKMKRKNFSPPCIKRVHRFLFRSILKVFEWHGTNFRIFISPLYKNTPLCSSDKHALESVFGKERVFDFSGYQYITENQGYYYEFSHYRPLVGEIMLTESYSRLP